MRRGGRGVGAVIGRLRRSTSACHYSIAAALIRSSIGGLRASATLAARSYQVLERRLFETLRFAGLLSRPGLDAVRWPGVPAQVACADLVGDAGIYCWPPALRYWSGTNCRQPGQGNPGLEPQSTSPLVVEIRRLADCPTSNNSDILGRQCPAGPSRPSVETLEL